MGIEENVQIVKDFFRSNGQRQRSKICWRWLPKILSESFEPRAGRWPARRRARGIGECT